MQVAVYANLSRAGASNRNGPLTILTETEAPSPWRAPGEKRRHCKEKAVEGEPREEQRVRWGELLLKPFATQRVHAEKERRLRR